ncbi:MAG: NAD-dependent epimerase/dehydratase family protein [Bacteroidota bacterium]|nr:NAD-dependent epimerase/dehydratase family protein [Bacteroidota bacterium]
MDKATLKNARVLVTGGAGFIGNNLVRKLLAENVSQILIMDNQSSGMSIFLPDDPRIIFVGMDIDKMDKLNFVINQHEFDYVFHLAAHFANQNSVDHPFSDIQTNIVGTVSLLEILKHHKSLKKFVYASSSCVYGTAEQMNEETFIYPSETPYSINKYTAELYTQYYAHLFHVPTLSIRIFNTYGPYEMAGKYRNVIPNFIEKALNNEDLIITGTGKETRDFTFVDDLVDLMIAAALSPQKDGAIFNGGTGSKTEILKMAEIIKEATGSLSNIIFKPARAWDKVKDRVSDTSKSASELGYQPKVNIEEGLLKTIKWYKDNYDKVKSLKNYFE